MFTSDDRALLTPDADYGASIRKAAALNGVYGIRPSVGAVNLDQVIPLNVRTIDMQRIQLF